MNSQNIIDLAVSYCNKRSFSEKRQYFCNIGGYTDGMHSVCIFIKHENILSSQFIELDRLFYDLYKRHCLNALTGANLVLFI